MCGIARLTASCVSWVLVVGCLATAANAQQRASAVRFAVTFPAERSQAPLDGRLLVFISADTSGEPRFQISDTPGTQQVFGIDVDGWKPGETRIVDASAFGYPLRSLGQVPRGTYRVQALINRYETFRRSDGHTVKLPPDKGEGQKWASKPGNLFSKPVKMRIDAASSGTIKISMDQEIPPIAPPQDTAQVKYIRVQNERLTKFWGRPMHLGAIVLLPSGWATHPNAHYPLVVHHGHFPSSMASDGWRETPPDAS